MKLGDLFIKLGLQKGDFDKGIDDAKRKTSMFGESMKKIGGMIAGVFAVGEIINFGKQSVMAYDAAAKAEQALLTALKGRVSIQKSLIEQAVELQGKTLFSDDETIRAQSLVAAFVKEEEQIKKLIPLIQDMATAKQMDLASAADLITKTFAGTMNALGRYGIQVEGAAGSAERLTMIQKGLNDAFGGQAEAAAKVGTGALTILANEYDNLQEVIGNLIISQQNQQGSFVKFLTSMTKGVADFMGKVSTWSDAGFGFVQSVVAAFASSDEETKKLADSLVVTKEKTEDLNKSASSKEPVKTAVEQLEAIRKVNDELEAQRILRQEFKGEKMAPITPLYQGAGDLMLQQPSDMGGVFGNLDSHYADITEKRKKWTAEELQGWTDFTDELNQIIESGISDAIGTMAAGFGEMLAMNDWDWSDFGSKILDSIGKFMQQFGAAMVAMGIAQLQLNLGMKTLNPALLIGGGAALIAAGAALSSLASQGMKGASAATSPASGYSNYSQSNAAAVISGNVVFELEGTKLRGALNNADRKNRYIR